MQWKTTAGLALLAGMALAWGKKSQIIYQGAESNNYVQVIETRKENGPFEHPAVLSAGRLEAALLEVRYLQPGLLGFGKKSAKPFAAFPPDEAAALSQYLSQALAKADSAQWVDFSWKVARRKSEGSIFVNFLVHDGVVFIQNGKLNLAFRNLGYEQILENDTRNRQDPTRNYGGSYDLVLPADAEWPARLLDAHGQPARRNWIAFPLAALAEAKPKLPETPAPQPLGQAPAAPATAPAAPAPAPAVPERSVEDRLRELKSLRDQGLITPQDYEQKKQEILEGL
jgi:hypothetical protein